MSLDGGDADTAVRRSRRRHAGRRVGHDSLDGSADALDVVSYAGSAGGVWWTSPRRGSGGDAEGDTLLGFEA